MAKSTLPTRWNYHCAKMQMCICASMHRCIYIPRFHNRESAGDVKRWNPEGRVRVHEKKGGVYSEGGGMTVIFVLLLNRRALSESGPGPIPNPDPVIT